ncbi:MULTISPECIES: hypothetical protein [Enterobacterales]|uniref:hypothetical protein n=1 Tax=Enterobacterales TaxID=91347 RepID=UPI002EDA7062
MFFATCFLFIDTKMNPDAGAPAGSIIHGKRAASQVVMTDKAGKSGVFPALWVSVENQCIDFLCFDFRAGADLVKK